jgi:hypothetical protein
MVDVLATVQTVLSGSWTAGNTDSITPTFGKTAEYNYKLLDLANNDYVLVYELPESIMPFCIDGTTFEQTSAATIMLWSTYKNAALNLRRAHMIKMKDEAIRILKANIKDPDANFRLMYRIRRRDLSDSRTGICKMAIDIDLKKWGA